MFEITPSTRLRRSPYFDATVADGVTGFPLRNIDKQGARRHQLGIVLEGDEPMAPHWDWYDVHKDGRKIGDITNGVWSYRLGRNIGFALVAREHKPGDIVVVIKDGARFSGTLAALPFI